MAFFMIAALLRISLLRFMTRIHDVSQSETPTLEHVLSRRLRPVIVVN